MTLSEYFGYLANPTLQIGFVISGVWLCFDLTLRLRRRRPLSAKKEVLDLARLVALSSAALLTGFWLKDDPLHVAGGVLVTLFTTIWTCTEAVRFFMAWREER